MRDSPKEILLRSFSSFVYIYIYEFVYFGGTSKTNADSRILGATQHSEFKGTRQETGQFLQRGLQFSRRINIKETRSWQPEQGE